MNLLPSEQLQRVDQAIQEFKESGHLEIFEPCDCGSRIQHNNGGNYHQEITINRDGKAVFIKYETTCDLVARAEWQECNDLDSVIREFADWL